jgi:magnesium transporter
MLTIYSAKAGSLVPEPFDPKKPLPGSAVWLDLISPTPEEDKAVEACVGVSVPTREDMAEIEASSRLYLEDGARFMTASVIAGVESDKAGLVNVTFILVGDRLVTVRHGEPRVIDLYIQRICKQAKGPTKGDAILFGMLEAVIDRTADILEKVGADIDDISQRVFGRHIGPVRAKKDYMAILRQIGRKGDLLSMARESLVSISRMVGFLSVGYDGKKASAEKRSQLIVMRRDADSLRDHTSYLGDKIIFLLDATVGMVTIEQNDLVKLFSVVAVILMPPTLIASIYGMNFHFMPELDSPYGYPLAVGAMIVAALVPYIAFRFKGWL